MHVKTNFCDVIASPVVPLIWASVSLSNIEIKCSTSLPIKLEFWTIFYCDIIKILTPGLIVVISWLKIIVCSYHLSLVSYSAQKLNVIINFCIMFLLFFLQFSDTIFVTKDALRASALAHYTTCFGWRLVITFLTGSVKWLWVTAYPAFHWEMACTALLDEAIHQSGCGYSKFLGREKLLTQNLDVKIFHAGHFPVKRCRCP